MLSFGKAGSYFPKLFILYSFCNKHLYLKNIYMKNISDEGMKRGRKKIK